MLDALEAERKDLPFRDQGEMKGENLSERMAFALGEQSIIAKLRAAIKHPVRQPEQR